MHKHTTKQSLQIYLTVTPWHRCWTLLALALRTDWEQKPLVHSTWDDSRLTFWSYAGKVYRRGWIFWRCNNTNHGAQVSGHETRLMQLKRGREEYHTHAHSNSSRQALPKSLSLSHTHARIYIHTHVRTRCGYRLCHAFYIQLELYTCHNRGQLNFQGQDDGDLKTRWDKPHTKSTQARPSEATTLHLRGRHSHRERAYLLWALRKITSTRQTGCGVQGLSI